MKALSRSFAFLLATGLVAGPASAQFPGDVYFQKPAEVVATSGQVTVRVLTFTGTQPFGAAHVTLKFDPAVLRAETVSLPASGAVRVSFQQRGGRLVLVPTNAKGTDRLFGIVTLAEITFRAIGAPTSTSPLDLEAVRMLALDHQEIPTRAFDGSVLVTDPDPRLAPSTSVGAPPPRAPFVVETSSPQPPTVAEHATARAFGRPGQQTHVWRPIIRDGLVAAGRVAVTIGPVANSADTPPPPAPAPARR